MRIEIILLSLVTFSTGIGADTSACEGIQDAIAVLVHNRKQIQEKIFHRDIPTTVYDIPKKEMNDLSAIIDTLISGKIGPDYKKLVGAFLSHRYEFSESLYGTYILSDTISIQFLSNLLRCDDEGIVCSAEQYLYRETGFDALKSQSTHIKRNIRQSPFSYMSFTLLSLLNLTKEEKDSLLRIKLPLNIKANIGDTTALDSMVALYKKETDLSSKGRLIESIMSTGQQRGVKVIMADLVKPLYEVTWQNTTHPCTTDVLHRMAVKGLPQRFRKVLFCSPSTGVFVVFEQMSKFAGEILMVPRSNLRQMRQAETVLDKVITGAHIWSHNFCAVQVQC
jgi:hypothetical protein